MGALFLALSVLVGLASAALAWGHVRRVTGATGADPEALALGLKRVPAAERIAELQRRARPGSWEHGLAAELLAAPGEGAKIAALNLAISDADHAMTRTARWPLTALRIALLGAGVLGFSAYIEDPAQLKWALATVAVGGVAAVACVEARRSGQRAAARQRRGIDALVAVALGLPEGPRGGVDPDEEIAHGDGAIGPARRLRASRGGPAPRGRVGSRGTFRRSA
jgi:hypothetical protein